MLAAALDTATLTLSCALVELDVEPVRALAARTEVAPARPGPQGPTGGHGGRLPGALQDLLAGAGRRLREVEAYAIGLGPGSFTGLRIGLATWKGLAYAHRRPMAGCSSLAAMALAARPRAPAGALLVPLLDARKGEVYAGFYRPRGDEVEPVEPDAALAPGALTACVAALRDAGDEVLVFGQGVEALGAAARALPVADVGIETPPAEAVAALCARSLRGAEYDAARLFSLEPRYVRASEAEIRFPHGHGPAPRG